MIVKINSLITKVRLLKAQTTNEHLLKEDEKILKSSFDSENDELNSEEIITFDKKKDYELVKALEDILLTSSSSEVDVEITFHIQLSVRLNNQFKADKKNSERIFSKTSQKDFIKISLDQNNKQISYKIYS